MTGKGGHKEKKSYDRVSCPHCGQTFYGTSGIAGKTADDFLGIHYRTEQVCRRALGKDKIKAEKRAS